MASSEELSTHQVEPSVTEIFAAIRDELFPDEKDWKFFIANNLDMEEALNYACTVIIQRGLSYEPEDYLLKKGILIP